MGSFLERLQIESAQGLYSRKKFGHPVNACVCIPSEGAPTLLDGELASDIIQNLVSFVDNRHRAGAIHAA
jgi:hypothetical protein